MSTAVTVLVTATGAAVGQGIMSALRMSSLDVRIVAVDADPGAAGLYRADVGVVVPLANAVNYVDEIVHICRRHHVGAVLVGSDVELMALTAGRDRLESETGAVLIASPAHIVEISCDKWLTAQFFGEHGLRHPQTFLAADFRNQVGLPVVLKPRFGSGSRNVFVVRDAEELAFFARRVPDPLVQEYVGSDDEEYTCGLVRTTDGKIPGVITMRRVLKDGTTYRAWVEDLPDVREEARRIAETVRPVGPCNVQMRRTSRGLVTFEINARFSSTTAVKARFGFNEPEMVVRSMLLGETIAPPSITPGVALRYWDELYTTHDAYNSLRLAYERLGRT